MRVCIVIPAYNEEKTLATNVARLRDFLASQPQDDSYTILIAENGSTDGTLSVAQELAKRFPDVRFDHEAKPGRGAALKKVWTMAARDHDVVGYMDADLSTELDALPRALAVLRGGADAVTGSRLARGAKVGRVMSREITSRVFNWGRRILLGGGVKDSQCGFKFLKTPVLRLLPEIKNDNWFFDTELLTRAQWAGFRVEEVPVTWAENRPSTVRVIPTIIEEGKGIMKLRKDRPRK